MNADASSLDDLRDIAVPPPVSWWPLAPGWWVVILIVASILKACTTLISADSSDIQGLVKKTATAPVAVTAEGEGTRWAEAGWWIVPIIALLSLSTFRREEQFVHEESAP